MFLKKNKDKVSKKEIADVIGIRPPKLSDRLKGNTRIQTEEEKRIYCFLLEKGFAEKDLTNLFVYSEKQDDSVRSPVQGRRIKEILEDQGKTQVQLAEEMGVDKNTVTNWIQGGTISEKNLMKLADCLDVAVSELISLNHTESKFVSEDYNDFLYYQMNCISEIRKIVMSYQYKRGYNLKTLKLSEDEKNGLDAIIERFLKDDVENYINQIRPKKDTTEYLIISDVYKKHIDEGHKQLEKIKYWDAIYKNSESKSEKERASNEIKILLEASKKEAQKFLDETLEVSHINTINNKRIIDRLQEMKDKKKQ